MRESSGANRPTSTKVPRISTALSVAGALLNTIASVLPAATVSFHTPFSSLGVSVMAMLLVWKNRGCCISSVRVVATRDCDWAWSSGAALTSASVSIKKRRMWHQSMPTAVLVGDGPRGGRVFTARIASL